MTKLYKKFLGGVGFLLFSSLTIFSQNNSCSKNLDGYYISNAGQLLRFSKNNIWRPTENISTGKVQNSKRNFLFISECKFIVQYAPSYADTTIILFSSIDSLVLFQYNYKFTYHPISKSDYDLRLKQLQPTISNFVDQYRPKDVADPEKCKYDDIDKAKGKELSQKFSNDLISKKYDSIYKYFITETKISNDIFVKLCQRYLNKLSPHGSILITENFDNGGVVHILESYHLYDREISLQGDYNGMINFYISFDDSAHTEEISALTFDISQSQKMPIDSMSQNYFKMINEARYDELYDLNTEEYKQKIQKEDFVDLLTQSGKLISNELIGSHFGLDFKVGRGFEQMQFRTVFSNANVIFKDKNLQLNGLSFLFDTTTNMLIGINFDLRASR